MMLFFVFFFFLMIRRPPRSTQSRSSAASDVYKRQVYYPSNVICQHSKTHFSSYFHQPFRQKIAVIETSFDSSERMFRHTIPFLNTIWIIFNSFPHVFKNLFMFPSKDYSSILVSDRIKNAYTIR